MEMKEFQRIMDEIYGERDKRGGIERAFMWIVEEIGELVRAYRRSDREEIENELADIVAWIFSLANLLEIDIEKSISKYLVVCPKCKKNPCECEEKLTL